MTSSIFPTSLIPVRRVSPQLLPFFALLVLAALPSQLNAQIFGGGIGNSIPNRSFLPIIGGPGGGQFQTGCNVGEYLIGLDLHAGDDVDAIRPVCRWNGPAHADAPFAGGNGGKLAQLRCPPSAPAVIGIDIAAEGAATVVVNNVHLFCGQPIAHQTPPAYPSAVFDGPSAVRSAPLFPLLPGGTSISATQGHEACPDGQYATGIHGRSGTWLDAVGLICAAAPPPPPAPSTSREPVKSIGRVNVGPGSTSPPAGSICESAASAKARNSPAAPTLEAQCSAQIAAAEKADLTPGASGAPISLCDAAQTALNTNAMEAADLVAKCRASGGGQHLISEADQLAASGASIAAADPLITELRNRQPAGPVRQGFDAGVAVTGSDTQWGPGKQKILDSLPAAGQEGFKVAASFVMDRNRNPQLAAIGASIAASDPVVAAARTVDPDVRYWLGFDIASGLFGDPALGAAGNKATGPGSARIRDSLSAPAQRGFNASTTLNLSRSH